MASYASFSEPFSKIAYGAAILTAKINLEFGATCHFGSAHRRQPRRGCRGRIPTNILVGGDINGNGPTNIRGGNVVEYELLIASVKRKQR